MPQKMVPNIDPDNGSKIHSEPAANTQQQKDRSNLIKGIGLAILTDILALIFLSLLAFTFGGGLSESNLYGFGYIYLLGFMLLALIGFWQFLVILPLIIYLKVKQQSHLIKGVLLGSGLVSLLNSMTCSGMMGI